MLHKQGDENLNKIVMRLIDNFFLWNYKKLNNDTDWCDNFFLITQLNLAQETFFLYEC